MSAEAQTAPAPGSGGDRQDAERILKLFAARFREKYPAAAERYLQPNGALLDKVSGVQIEFNPEVNAWIIRLNDYYAVFSRKIVKRLIIIDFLMEVLGLTGERATIIQQLLSMGEDCIGVRA